MRGLILAAAAALPLLGCGGAAILPETALSDGVQPDEALSSSATLSQQINAKSVGMYYAGDVQRLTYDNANGRVTESAKGTAGVRLRIEDDKLIVEYQTLGKSVTLRYPDDCASGCASKSYVAGQSTDGTFMNFATLQGIDLDDVRNGGAALKYSVPFRFQISSDGRRLDYQGFGVLGRETLGSEIPVSGTASFDGFFMFNSTPKTFGQSDTLLIGGTVNMLADFGAAESISGQFNASNVYNFTTQNTSTSALVFDIKNGQINGSELAADLDLNAQSCGAQCWTVSEFKLRGKFFGPRAEEAGGPLSLDYLDENGVDRLGAGVFTVKQ